MSPTDWTSHLGICFDSPKLLDMIGFQVGRGEFLIFFFFFLYSLPMPRPLTVISQRMQWTIGIFPTTWSLHCASLRDIYIEREMCCELVYEAYLGCVFLCCGVCPFFIWYKECRASTLVNDVGGEYFPMKVQPIGFIRWMLENGVAGEVSIWKDEIAFL